jgi:hypothetical protein
VGVAQSRGRRARTRRRQPRLVLGSDFSASLEAVRKLLDGSIPGLPHFGFSLVDVRDIAALQLLATTTPSAAGQRFIGSCDFYRMAKPRRGIPTRWLRPHLTNCRLYVLNQRSGLSSLIGVMGRSSDEGSRDAGCSPLPR